MFILLVSGKPQNLPFPFPRVWSDFGPGELLVVESMKFSLSRAEFFHPHIEFVSNSQSVPTIKKTNKKTQ